MRLSKWILNALKTKNPALSCWVFARDPGGILTPNPQSRNLMRYTVAPRSHYLASEQLKYPKGQLRHGAIIWRVSN